ncbi:MAG TPA: hypothetical protein VNZ64_06230 [Candidatus Acidoferrum sp.]|jgi:hypothetical protein|nr:hypothetical protein [Candidatus Acidoferrum sp.]
MTTTKLNILPVAALVITFVPVISRSAQVTLPDIAEITVRAGANANVVINVVNVGFERVKYVQDGSPGNTTSCAKSYFKWDFTGQNPNTNADLVLSLTGVANSQLSAMRVWSLDQAYPAFTNSTGAADSVTNITWNSAQANDTNFVPALGAFQGTFQMLTNGPFTAHPVANFSAAGTTTVTIPAPWGNLIISNQLVFAILGTNNSALAGNNGYRIQLNTSSLVFNSIVGTNPPSISPLPNVTVVANRNSVTNSFTLSDPDGNPASFNGTTVTATSSDPTGTIIAGVTILGSGASQMIYVTAGGTPGTATVEVTATDELGDQAQGTFSVTVLPEIFPPTISTAANTNTSLDTPVVVPFTIGDSSAPLSTLTVNASVDPVSTNELASATLTGSGSNRSVTVMPAANADGVGLVDLSVSDTNGNTATTSFAVMVLPNYAVFDDHFDYQNGSIFPNSDGIWARRGNVQFTGLNILNGAVDVVSGAVNDNGYGTLVGAPYTPNQGAVIYITFTGNWSGAPTANSGGFVSLANNNTTSSPQVCNIGSTPDFSGDGGNLYLTIANNTGFTTNFSPIVLGTPYTIAARYDVDTATATLWINATNEADISATNAATATDVTAPTPVSLVDLNQNGNTGGLILDDLKVSVVTKPALATIRVVSGNVQIDFTVGATDTVSNFGVLAAPNVNGPFAPASATFSSLGGGAFRGTLPASGNQGFYRLFRQPFNF